jgi:hypothetical protein
MPLRSRALLLLAVLAAGGCVEPSLDAATAVMEPPMEVSLSLLPAVEPGRTLRAAGTGGCGISEGPGWEVRFAGRDSATAADLVLRVRGGGAAAMGQLAWLWLDTGSDSIDGPVTVVHSTSGMTLRMVLNGTVGGGTRLSGTLLCRLPGQGETTGGASPDSGSNNPKEKAQ